MSIRLANLIGFFRSHKEPDHEQAKAIQLLQTMQWSKLCWDASWEDTIELEDLLPEVGKTYPIKLEENEDFTQDGQALILWQPPHSDLNGWYDKRPSEILKSYVIEGILTDRYSDHETREINFNFKVSKRSSLVDYFFEAPLNRISSLSSVGQGDGSSRVQWQDAQYIQKYSLGKFLYLSGSEGDTGLELILSCEESKICIHYSATLHYPAHYETVITKHYLDRKEQKIIESIIDKATEIIDTSDKYLTDTQILGAEYW